MRTVHTSAAAILMITSGWLTLTASPAQAVSPSAGPASIRASTARPVSSCRYQFDHLKRGETIAVLAAPRRGQRVLGKLAPGGRAVTGGCAAKSGWLQVATPTGAWGWASAHHLRRLPAGTRSFTPRAGSWTPGCRYTVWGIRPSSHLNVRSGAGFGHRPIAVLHPNGHAVTGACAGRRGWLQVTTSTGAHGWAWNGYLRKTTSTR